MAAMSSNLNTSPQLQIRFTTKQEQYSVADTPLVVPSSITSNELNNLINTLIQETKLHENEIEFEFLIDGEYLKLSLDEHLERKALSSEAVIDVEYIERLPAPEPQDCLLHDDWVSSVQVRGKWVLTGCYDNTVQIWNLKGLHQATVSGHTGPIRGVAWLNVQPERATFVSGSHDQTAMLWEWNIETDTTECLAVYKGHERNIETLSANPSGTMFATGGWDTMLKIWSTSLDEFERSESGEHKSKRSRMDTKSATKTPIMTLKGHKDCVSCVKWMKDEVLTASWDHTLKIWETDIGGIKQEIIGNKSFFYADMSELNGTIATASADRNIRIYDPRSADGAIIKSTLTSHTQWVQAVEWSKTDENLFISGGYDNLLKLWDWRSPRAPLFDLTGHEDKILCCDWSEPSVMASGGADNTLRLFKYKQTLKKINK